MTEPRAMPARDLIPQQPPMRLLDEYIDLAPPHAAGRTRFAPNGIFTASDGAVSPAGLVEAIAQTAAAAAFLEIHRAAPNEPPPPPGYLVGLRDFVFAPQGAQASQTLDLRLRETHRLGPARLYDATATSDSGEIARGVLKVWQPEDPAGGNDANPCAAATLQTESSANAAHFTVAESLAAHLQFLETSEPETTEARLFIDPALPPFAGHFPGNPILPGVCLIEAALLVARAHAPAPIQLAAIENARFTRPARPGETLRLKTTRRPPADGAGPAQTLRVDITTELGNGVTPNVATITLGLQT